MIKGYAKLDYGEFSSLAIIAFKNKEGLPKGYDNPVVVFEAGELKKIKDLFESILCLSVEGPEVSKRRDLLRVISEEAREGLKILGKEG